MRSDSGLILSSPVRNVVANPARPSSTQSWSNDQGPSITSRIPATTTMSETGMKIRCASHSDWPKSDLRPALSPPRSKRLPSTSSAKPVPSQIATPSRWINSKTS